MNATECTKIEQNTYYAWNSQQNIKYENSNNILINVIKFERNKPCISAFEFSTKKDVTNKIDIQNLPPVFMNQKLYETCDIAEIIRADYSRLFFDIDIDVDKFNDDEFNLCIEQLQDIFSIITPQYASYVGGTYETQVDGLGEKISSVFPKMIKVINKHNKKMFSSHIHLINYYFNRDDLFNIFSAGNHSFKLQGIHLSRFIDRTVFSHAGKQKPLRFGLSGKLIKNRPAGVSTVPLTEIDFNYLFAQRTSKDTIYIANTSETFNNLANYIKQFYVETNHKTAPRKSKDDFKNKMEAQIDDNLFKSEIIKHAPTTHAQWYHNLINQVKKYIFYNPKVTNEELYDEFKKEKYQYYSNSNQRKLLQPYSINAAIRVARENPRISFNDVIDENNQSDETCLKNNVESCLKYNISQFKNLVSKPCELNKIAVYLHYSFIFFTSHDSNKPTSRFFVFLDNGNVVVRDINDFSKDLKGNPIKVNVYFEDEVIDLRNHQKKIVSYSKKFDLLTIFDILDNYKQKFHDFKVFTLDKTCLSLYNKPTSHEPTPLPKEVEKIIDLIATERSIDNEYTINPEKKEFILNWFAYIIQHPESRNKTCLHVTSVQGIGKNIISNAICDFIGKNFSIPNLNIENILGTYNGIIENKMFVCVNEVNSENKDQNKMKTYVTEDTIPLNHKYGANYMADNIINFLVYSNNFDTKLIDKGDRRFAYINSQGLPYPKSFYASICEKGSDSRLKKNLQEQFINHLLSRDLSEYSPDKAPDFDKETIYEMRNECRSPIFNILLTLLTKKFNYILKEDYLNTIENAAYGRLMKNDKFVTLSEYYDLKELEQYNNLSEFTKVKLTAQTLGTIMNFESQSEIISKKSKKRDETRDKYVYMLRQPIIPDTPKEEKEIIDI